MCKRTVILHSIWNVLKTFFWHCLLQKLKFFKMIKNFHYFDKGHLFWYKHMHSATYCFSLDVHLPSSSEVLFRGLIYQLQSILIILRLSKQCYYHPHTHSLKHHDMNKNHVPKDLNIKSCHSTIFTRTFHHDTKAWSDLVLYGT